MSNNIQFYWDGTSGVCTYGSRKAFFKTKPTIPTVTYDMISYSDEEPGIALKVLKGTTVELTEAEITAITQYCDANATSAVVEAQSVGEHNADSTSHHDIRVALSNLAQYAHKVASVWSTEGLLSDLEGDVIWEYILGDLNDCSLTGDKTAWICPEDELYDLTVQVGLEGVDTSEAVDVTVAVKVNGAVDTTKTHTIAKGTENVPVLSLELVGKSFSYRDKITVSITTSNNTGVLVPSRTFLIVDNHGATKAKRQANYYFNTLGNHIYYKGYDLTLTGDSQGAQVIASQWNPNIISI